MDLEEGCEELERYFSTLDIVGERVMKKKVWELIHPSTCYMCSTPAKFKPKRRNKKSRKGEESYMHRDPSQWEYVEGSWGSQTMNISFTKPIESQPVSQSSRLLYLSQFHVFLHHNIDDIVDVGKDDKCRFRSIVVLLGWGEDF